LEEQHFSFIEVLSTYYVYVVPTKVANLSRDKAQLQKFLQQYGYILTSSQLDKLFQQQIHKYIKLFSSANPQIAQEIKDLKNQYYSEKSSDNVPVLHGVILEPLNMRYYPRGEFMSNIL
jgi:ABC-type oligopeptide transport system ATPase subunit